MMSKIKSLLTVNQKLFLQRAIAKILICFNKKGRKKSKTNRHGFIGQWIEPKLFTIYVVDEQGKKVKNSEIPITNDGTYEGYKSLLLILEAHLARISHHISLIK